MVKKSKIVAVVATLLIAAAGLITIQSCKKDKVEEKTPTASFSYSPSTIYTGTTVYFTNYSENAATYRWSFGDGQTSDEYEPSHEYSSAGTFTVELTAYSPSGNKYNSTTKTVTVTERDPIASFSVSTSYPSTYESVSFTNSSSYASSYLWNFGDGSTSTLKNPTHYYSTTGSKTVKLTAYSQSGNKSDYTTKTITVSSSSSKGDLMFWTDASTIYNITVTFRSVSKTITSYYTSTPSYCGSSGCATYWDVEPGTYYFTASNYLYTWSGYVTVYSDTCSKMLLYAEKGEKQSNPENQSTEKLVLGIDE